MREIVAESLFNYITQAKLILRKVAVVGGTSKDLEVELLKGLFGDIEFHYFGIDNPENDENFKYVDLNEENFGTQEYDLVLCSQVLEHIWNLHNAFDFLVSITGTSGLLWINCPSSNMVHGSPEYFSAGYAPEFLIKNLELRGHKTLMSGCVGSKRFYFMTHILRFWAVPKEHNHPIMGYHFQNGSTLGILRKLLRDLPGRLNALLFSPKISDSLEFATESYTLTKVA